MKINIVGGSIAGLSAGVCLKGLGYEIAIFEKSAGSIEARGGGIVVQPENAGFFKYHGIDIYQQMSLQVSGRKFFQHDGTVRWTQPVVQHFTAWDTIYRCLRKLFGENRYYPDSEVVDYKELGESIESVLANGQRSSCDLLICADGGMSRFRTKLFPESPPRYAGYVAWRGVYPEACVNQSIIDRKPYVGIPYSW